VTWHRDRLEWIDVLTVARRLATLTGPHPAIDRVINSESARPPINDDATARLDRAVRSDADSDFVTPSLTNAARMVPRFERERLISPTEGEELRRRIAS
jgi:hypothetical protein